MINPIIHRYSGEGSDYLVTWLSPDGHNSRHYLNHVTEFESN